MDLKNKIGKVFTTKFVGTGALVLWKKSLPGRGHTKVDKNWTRQPSDSWWWRRSVYFERRDVWSYPPSGITPQKTGFCINSRCFLQGRVDVAEACRIVRRG